MQRIVLFDTEEDFGNLLPITFTRPISHIRVGITTLREKWEALLQGEYCERTAEFLSEIFKCQGVDCDEDLHVCGSVVANEQLAAAVTALSVHEELRDSEGKLIAFRGCPESRAKGDFKVKVFEKSYGRLNFVYDIFLQNGNAIREDFARLTAGRESQVPHPSNLILGDYVDAEGMPMLFIEEGAIVEGATLNLKDGPIYIGRNAKVMEGSCLRGPIAICHDAQVKMGAKIYASTTLGPWCKAGGELNNVVMIGYSNKSHDGFLGNAVIGEWCNIGAGVNASNLKNDYSKIRIWNYPRRSFMRTDLQFCGLIMGDHSKAGVNVMFNTATVVGVGVNVYGAGFPRVFVPSFSEGSAATGFSDVSLKKFFDVAERVMGRRGKSISELERKVFGHVYEVSQSHK